MADARQEEAWNHTASVMACVLNAALVGCKDAKLVEPDELHPMKRKRIDQVVQDKETAFALMRKTFVKGETHGTCQ